MLDIANLGLGPICAGHAPVSHFQRIGRGHGWRNHVAQLCEARAHLPHGDEAKWRACHPPRKERLASSQRHGSDLNDDLVQQSCIVELAGEVTASGDPDVFEPAALRISA